MRNAWSTPALYEGEESARTLFTGQRERERKRERERERKRKREGEREKWGGIIVQNYFYFQKE
jgi:hypothetical protein